MHQVQSGLRRGRWGAAAPADLVTASRVVLTVAVAAIAVLGLPPALLAGVLLAALLSDLVDGPVARRTGTASAFGARFDMEADSLLILVLSVVVAIDIGWWVLGLGLARYLFAVVVWSTPALQLDPPPRYWCKVVAAFVAAVLAVSAVGILPTPVEVTCLLLATVLLMESFAHEAVDRWRVGALFRGVAFEHEGSRG